MLNMSQQEVTEFRKFIKRQPFLDGETGGDRSRRLCQEKGIDYVEFRKLELCFLSSNGRETYKRKCAARRAKKEEAKKRAKDEWDKIQKNVPAPRGIDNSLETRIERLERLCEKIAVATGAYK